MVHIKYSVTTVVTTILSNKISKDSKPVTKLLHDTCRIFSYNIVTKILNVSQGEPMSSILNSTILSFGPLNSVS
jgi:hypothetical protein